MQSITKELVFAFAKAAACEKQKLLLVTPSGIICGNAVLEGEEQPDNIYTGLIDAVLSQTEWEMSGNDGFIFLTGAQILMGNTTVNLQNAVVFTSQITGVSIGNLSRH